MNKAVFLDRDGTINIDFGYIHTIDRFELIAGSIEGLKLLQDHGYLLIVITNQSGIGRGYFTEEEYLILEEHISAVLLNHGIKIAKTYHCPHIDSSCTCRKPETGMFYKAAKEFDIDFSKSYAIGDKERDLSICEKEAVTGILLSEKGKIHNLLEAANYICGHDS